jgi:hypothetical protein
MLSSFLNFVQYPTIIPDFPLEKLATDIRSKVQIDALMSSAFQEAATQYFQYPLLPLKP